MRVSKRQNLSPIYTSSPEKWTPRTLCHLFPLPLFLLSQPTTAFTSLPEIKYYISRLRKKGWYKGNWHGHWLKYLFSPTVSVCSIDVTHTYSDIHYWVCAIESKSIHKEIKSAPYSTPPPFILYSAASELSKMQICSYPLPLKTLYQLSTAVWMVAKTFQGPSSSDFCPPLQSHLPPLPACLLLCIFIPNCL